MAEIILGRLKFNWKGDWTAATAYIKDDVVKYGPSAYVCVTNHTSTSEFNFNNFELMSEGVSWAGEWNDSTSYQENDIVNYGGAIYICIRDHAPGDSSDTSPNSQDFWSRLVGGFEWESTYNALETYQRGDVVKYGGYTYICLQTTIGNAPTNVLYWEELNRGYSYQGEFSNLSSYLPGELVKYGGKIFSCIATTTPGTLPTNDNFWFLFADSFRWRDTWSSGASYLVGDIVKYGAYAYIAIQPATGTSLRPTVQTHWTVLTEGFDWKGAWSSAGDYKPGDVVKYGARLFVCVQEVFADGSTQENPEVDSTSWDLMNDGLQWANEWNDSTNYLVGDVVRYGGRSYICISNHTGNGTATFRPTNATYWNLLNKGLDFKGAWSSLTEYKLDDVVEYSGSAYVSIASNNINYQPNISTGYWQALAVGDSNAVMTTTGDMIYRNAVGATVRLPIGPSGAFLVVNNGIPSWGTQAPERNYYVSLQGDDNNDGRTVATAWRTLQHAAMATFNEGQCKISVMAGTYNELCPMKLGRFVVLEGDGLGAVTVSPDNSNDKGYGAGISKDGSTPNANSDVFHVNNGARIRNIVFRGFGSGAVCVSLDPGYGPNDTSVWITSQSPYVQNCTSFTDNGTGMVVDGALHNGGYKSIVANDWTQINSDGYGMIVKNDGRSELVSCFTYYCYIGYLCEGGGKIRSVAGNNSYGTFGAVARGYSQSETPLQANIQLTDDTLNSITTYGSNVRWNASYKDSSGNLYLLGHTNPTGGTISATWSNSASNPVVAKLDTSGGLDWLYTYETRYGSLNSAVEIDQQIYFGGVIYDAATNKGFLLKLNPAGEIGWQKTIGDVDEVVDVLTDGNFVFALGNHNTNGINIIRVQPSGILSWSRVIDYNDSSINTLVGKSMCFAGLPTTSVDSYANEGDATAEDDIFIACRDTTANLGMIVRVTNAGALVTAYQYGNVHFNKLRLDTGNGDGIYMAAVGYYDPAGALTANPFIARISILGDVEWQRQLGDSTANGQYIDVFPQGNDVYAVGYMNDTANGYNRGLAARYSSNGTLRWATVTTNSTNNIAFTGIQLDGVNVLASGLSQTNGILLNVQRDKAGGIGTVTSGLFAFNDISSPSDTNNSLLIKGIQNVYLQSVSVALSDSVLTLNQSPGLTRSIAATRTGFAGIGTGVNFSISGLIREPKPGSVAQIYGDDETYFVVGVDNYQAPTIQAGNYPSARYLLRENKEFLKAEVIAYINDTYPAFVYNEATCARDVGLIVDALEYDLNFNTNGESIEAGLAYYNSTSGLIAITTQQTETVAAITHLKSIIDEVLGNTAITPTTGNTESQFIDLGFTAEAGSITLTENNLDTIIDIIQYGSAVAPPKTGYGTAEIALDPPIPSNKTPDDGTQIIFREAFSQVRMTGHDFLDIGTGGFASTNYPVIIASDYTQAPTQLNETDSTEGGRVFYVTTDQDGNFRVGDYFKVEQATGRSTINAQEFNLSGLNELQLGSITAGRQGATVNEFSTDGTFEDNSDTAVPTERAVKTYVDNAIIEAIGSANTLVVGNAPLESKVEVVGTGTTTDTIEFDISGTERVKIGNQYMLIPKGDTASRPTPAVSGYIRYNTDFNALEVYNGSAWVPAGGLSNNVVTSTPYAASAFQYLWINTSSTPITVTLPATANQGDEIRFLDVAGTFDTNNLTIDRNGNNIQGQAQNLVVSTERAGFSLVYYDATQGWLLKDR